MNKLGFVVVALVGVACGDNGDKPKVDSGMPDSDNSAAVARGQYIMNVLGACTFCHTPLLPNGMRDQSKLLAGVDCFFDADSPTGIDNGTGMGCLSTRNLTNHETGLKNATDTQIKNAFRNGIRTDDKKIAPIMPYWIFHNMSDEDADAVVAYLRTVPGVDHQVTANQTPWSLYNDGTIPPVAFVTEAEIPMPRADTSIDMESAMRGRYLSAKAGLCIDCHTPEPPNSPFGTLPLDFSRAFGGGRVFPKGALGLIDPVYPDFIMTRNLTSDATGLMGWTRQQIKNTIAEGRDRDNNSVCAATHGGAISPYAALEAQDLDDIVEYIYSLPAVANDTTGCSDMGCGDCAGPAVP